MPETIRNILRGMGSVRILMPGSRGCRSYISAEGGFRRDAERLRRDGRTVCRAFSAAAAAEKEKRHA